MGMRGREAPTPAHMAIVLSETPGRYTTCDHREHWPDYNAEDCRYLTAEQIRERFPRFDGECQRCKVHVVIYASVDHWRAGGW